MPRFRLKTTECRIGVVGVYNAGKTVLMTSLINHLENHDPDRFPLGKPGTTLRKFTRLPVEENWTPFNYTGFRDALVHSGRWPEKTRDRSMFACQFERSDWKFSDGILKLYDLPGERLADASMLTRSYEEWSDGVMERIWNDTPYRTACEPFLNAVVADVQRDQVLTTYKLALANLILAFKPMVSPSTFLLDIDGKVARPQEAAALAASRVCGLNAQSEYAPLPVAARAAAPALAAEFAQHYETYKQFVVMPFLQALGSCHSLIVLVDIPMVLAGGVGMYDDNRQILRDLFDVLDPGENTLQAIGRNLSKVFLPHQYRPGWINRVAFVAPKLDLIHPQDRDKMLGLLRRMVGKLAQDRDGLKYDFFNCSAVVSTRLLPGAGDSRYLVGVPYRDVTGKRIPPGEEQRFVVSALPDDWPANWLPGKYTYPEVYPLVPPRKDCPPEQINLHSVLDFVLR
jgi:predicted YcjX-like family ATPase